MEASSYAVLALFSLILVASNTEARPDPAGHYWQAGLVHKGTSVSPLPTKKSDCHTQSFAKDFIPRPNISSYDDDDKKAAENDKSFAKDFEPRPNISVYDNGTGLKAENDFGKDFEPRPNISVYDNGTGLKEKDLDKDFEPRPNISVYGE